MARSKGNGKELGQELKDELKQLKLQITKLGDTIETFTTHEFTPGGHATTRAAARAAKKSRRRARRK